jgi:maltose O-acetyltransferase
MDVGKVKIGNNCWIGAGVIILKDVDLGDGCVVGAGAVVTKGFPHGSVIAGVPAKPIR